MFFAEVWGTVGQWAAALSTAAAFVSTLYIIGRDRKYRLREHADQISVHLESKYTLQDMKLAGFNAEIEEWRKFARKDRERLPEGQDRDLTKTGYDHFYRLHIYNPTDYDITGVRLIVNPYSYFQYRRVYPARKPSKYCPKVNRKEWYYGPYITSAMEASVNYHCVVKSKQSQTVSFATRVPEWLFTPVLVFTDSRGSWAKNAHTRKVMRYTDRSANHAKVLTSRHKYRSGFYNYAEHALPNEEWSGLDKVAIGIEKTVELLQGLRRGTGDSGGRPQPSTVCIFGPDGRPLKEIEIA